jgi:hypothetical protein
LILLYLKVRAKIRISDTKIQRMVESENNAGAFSIDFRAFYRIGKNRAHLRTKEEPL